MVFLASACIAAAVFPNPGPGLGSQTYDGADLYLSVSEISPDAGGPLGVNTQYGYNLAHMVNGYLVTVFAQDGGGVNGDTRGGIQFWDVSDPKNPIHVNTIWDPDGLTARMREIHSMAFAELDGKVIMVLQSQKGIQIWDISDVNEPVRLSLYEFLPGGNYDNTPWSLAWQYPYVYVTGANSGLHIIDVSDLEAPEHAGASIPTSVLGNKRVATISMMGNRGVIGVASIKGGFVYVDFSKPLNPLVLSNYESYPNRQYSTGWRDNHIFPTSRDTAVSNPVFHISNDGELTNVGEVTGIVETIYINFQDDKGFWGGQDRMLMLDISVPSAPETLAESEVGPIDDPDLGNVIPFGNVAFYGNDHGTGSGFLVTSISPDTTPPAIDMCSPIDGEMGVGLQSRIGLAFTDNLLLESVDTSSIVVRPMVDGTPGAAIDGVFTLGFNMVNFTPASELLPETTYRVEVLAGGVTDWAGNAFASTVTYEFTTGPTHSTLANQAHAWSFEEQQALDLVGDNDGIYLGDVSAADGWLILDGVDDQVSLSENLDELRGTASLEFTLATTQDGGRRPWLAPGVMGSEVYLSQDDIFWGWINTDGHLCFSVGNADPVMSNYPINDGEVRQYLLTRDAFTGEVKIYVDGELHGSDTMVGGIIGVTFNSFGRIENSEHAGYFLEGELSNVSIYNKVLELVEPYSRSEVGEETELNLGQSLLPGDVTYTWDFGEGQIETTSTHTLDWTFNEPGHYTILRKASNGVNQEQASLSHIVTLPATANPPKRSSTMAVWQDQIVCVNSDNDSCSVLAASAPFERLNVIDVGTEPTSLAVDSSSNVWIVSKGDAVLRKNLTDDVAEYALPLNSQPHGIVIDSADVAYVTLEGSGKVLKLDLPTMTVLGEIEVAPWPRGLALNAAEDRLYVSHFISPDAGGIISEIDPNTLQVLNELTLPADTTTADSSVTGRGVPNYLGAPSISPDGGSMWVPSKKDNIFRGTARDDEPLTFESTVRSIIGVFDLAGGATTGAELVDLDDMSFPVDIEFTPAGAYAIAAVELSNQIVLFDGYTGRMLGGLEDIGRAPQSLMIYGDFLFVHLFIDREIVVYNIAGILEGVDREFEEVARISTVVNEALPTQVYAGKRVFYNAADGRMSRASYIACASCHDDGGQDGRVWDFTQLGEGLRNTQSLKGPGGMGHGRLHWSGNFDEVQDFENPIRQHFGGSGFVDDTLYHAGAHASPLGDPLAGLSEEMDAVAAYLASLNEAPLSPYRASADALTPTALRGREHFMALRCYDCHETDAFTDSSTGQLHDVGTILTTSGGRLGQALTGIDTPTLRGVWRTAPYLHDGSASTLREVLTSRNTGELHGEVSSLDSAELDELVDYLRQLDSAESNTSNFERWRADHYTAAEVVDQALGQKMGNDDGDGYDNQTEFALGMNPWSGNVSQPFQLDLKGAGINFAIQSLAEGEVSVRWEYSQTMAPGSWLPLNVVETNRANAEGTTELEYSAPALEGLSPVFVRMVVGE